LTQTHLESITDALQEIELLIDEDEGVPYKIGDSFYTLSSEEATERMEGEKVVVEAQVEGLEEQLETIREELNKLKAKLYGKFGTSINLEK
jgi:prefoldin subunit 4